MTWVPVPALPVLRTPQGVAPERLSLWVVQTIPLTPKKLSFKKPQSYSDSFHRFRIDSPALAITSLSLPMLIFSKWLFSSPSLQTWSIAFKMSVLLCPKPVDADFIVFLTRINFLPLFPFTLHPPWPPSTAWYCEPGARSSPSTPQGMAQTPEKEEEMQKDCFVLLSI